MTIMKLAFIKEFTYFRFLYNPKYNYNFKIFQTPATTHCAMKVIGAGLSRTGTLSTKAALGQLMGPCYHGVVPLIERPDHRQFWLEAMAEENLNKEKTMAFLAEYEAGVDIPFMGRYKELLTMYPDAKVLLTVRDAKSWYKSARLVFDVLRTIGCHQPYRWFMTIVGLGGMSNFMQRLAGHEQLPIGVHGRMIQALYEGEDTAVEFFNRHIEEVKSVVPSEKLLIFDVRQGWEPLCKFLAVPVPDEPFPKMNDAKQLRSIFNCVKLVAWVTIIGVPALVASSYFLMPTTYLPVLALCTLGMLWVSGWTVTKMTNDYTLKARSRKDTNENVLNRKGQ